MVRLHMIRLLTCHCLSLPLGVLLKLLYEVIQRIAPGCIGRAEAVWSNFPITLGCDNGPGQDLKNRCPRVGTSAPPAAGQSRYYEPVDGRQSRKAAPESVSKRWSNALRRRRKNWRAVWPEASAAAQQLPSSLQQIASRREEAAGASREQLEGHQAGIPNEAQTARSEADSSLAGQKMFKPCSPKRQDRSLLRPRHRAQCTAAGPLGRDHCRA